MKAIARMQIYPAEFGVKVSFMLNTEVDSVIDAICNDMNATYPQVTCAYYRQNHNVIISGSCDNEFVNIITRFIEQMEDAYTAMEKLLAIQKDINAGE